MSRRSKAPVTPEVAGSSPVALAGTTNAAVRAPASARLGGLRVLRKPRTRAPFYRLSHLNSAVKRSVAAQGQSDSSMYVRISIQFGSRRLSRSSGVCRQSKTTALIPSANPIQCAILPSS
jgi:hypothetical protein